MMASIFADSLPDLISETTLIDHHIPMQMYHSNCTSRTNWFDLTGTPSTSSEPKPLNGLESIKGLLNTEVDDIYHPTYFWEQSDVPSPWNLDWTAAATYRGCLKLDHPVFGDSLTRNWGAHSWFNCVKDTPCWCEGHDCKGMYKTKGHAPVAATAAKAPKVSVIVVESHTPTPSELDQFDWYW
jgi:hypothetical protein